MRSARFLSTKLLEQIADPRSRFNLDYLAYRKGEIACAELIARLPHVARSLEFVGINQPSH